MKDLQSMERWAQVLGVCFLISVGVLLLWFLSFVLLKDVAYSLHERCFPLEQDGFALAWYQVLTLFKVIAVAFFLVPWLALKLVLHRERRLRS